MPTLQYLALRRRRFHQVLLGSAALGVGLGVAPGLWAQGKPEKPKVTIAVGGKSSFYHLPLTIAEQLGYFKAEGLEVEISDFAGGTRALEAVAAGAVDVVGGAYEHTIHLQSKNQAYQAFVLQGRAPGIALAVSLKAMPNFKAVADLRGKKIGVSALGSSTNMVAGLVLQRAGLKPDELSFIGVGTAAAAVAAVRAGQVDALCNVDPAMTMLEQKAEVRLIVDTRTLKGAQELFGGQMPAGCLYAPQEFVQKNPRTVQALANAVVHALKWLQTAGPGDILKTVPEQYLLGDRSLYLASFNKVREALALDGVLPEEGAQTALKTLASFDPQVEPRKINLGKTYTNEFARKAKDKFKA